jgi:hypothetical protein
LSIFVSIKLFEHLLAESLAVTTLSALGAAFVRRRRFVLGLLSPSNARQRRAQKKSA